MQKYHKFMMHVNGIFGFLAVFTGFYYSVNYLIFLGIFNFFCVYISHRYLKIFENQ